MKLATTSGPVAAGGPLPLPPGVRLLADHLDTVLAIAEDLSREHLALPSRAADDPRPVGMHTLVASQRQLIQFVRTIRTLELSMIARLIQARKLAGELRRSHPTLRPLVQLFHAGTAIVEHAGQLVGDGTVDTGEQGEAAMEFLRSRHIIHADAPWLAGRDALAIDETMQLLGKLHLGALMDLVATFLDKLDAMFELYPEADETGLAIPSGLPEGNSVTLAHAPDLTVVSSAREAEATGLLSIGPDRDQG